MTSLMNIAIGPVQSYISQARRTQDLWHGSRMLSYLAKVGATRAQDYGTLIFPALDESGGSIPNRFVLKTDNDPAHVAEQVEDRIQSEWRDVIGYNTLTFFQDKYLSNMNLYDENLWQRIWHRQLDTWLEYYWVAVPYDPEDYPTTIKLANRAMAQRKLMRDFKPYAEDGHKCSITGEHEALHGGRTSYREVRNFWEDIRKQQRNLSLLNEGERLSAISVIKRLAHEPDAGNAIDLQTERFPSTSSVASILFRERIVDNWAELKDDVQSYLDSLVAMFKHENIFYFTKDKNRNPEFFPRIWRKYTSAEALEVVKLNEIIDDPLLLNFLSFDGDFLYDDTLISRTLEEYGATRLSNRQLDNTKNYLSQLLSSASELEIPRPSPYLAILAMDGDHIGNRLKDIGHEEEHLRFSKALAAFATNVVPSIVENDYAGRLVYSGGDDVMALMPVEHVLLVANAIQKAFTGHMENYNFGGLTMSAGVAITHRTMPLQRAIRSARDAEKRAKNQYGRNVIAVNLIRRSGEDFLVGMNWELDRVDMVAEINAFIQDFRNKNMSYNIPYELDRIHYQMVNTEKDDELRVIIPLAARQAELERTLKRRATEQLNKNDKKELIQRWASTILRIAEPTQHDICSSWNDATGWTKLARFIAQGGDE